MSIMFSLRKQHKLLSSLLLLAVLLPVFALSTDRDNGVHGVERVNENESRETVPVVNVTVSLPPASSAPLKRAPKDYAYSPEGSRVRDLVGFFESMKDNFYDSDVRDKQNHVVISLSEAASKLRTLSGGFPLDVKCNKYVKLISQPNIRSYSTVGLLVDEEKQSSETEQNDINFASRLINERRFDALARLQTIIQLLESERANMRSTYEPSVQKDLLDCLNYYIYRHQRATLGFTDYVRESMKSLEQFAAGQANEEDVSVEKFQTLMEEIKQIEHSEEGQENNGARWLAALSKLHTLVAENQRRELPKFVQKFVIEPARLERLRKYRRMLNQVDELKNQISATKALQEGLLAASVEQNIKYNEAILVLDNLVERNKDIMSRKEKEPDQSARTINQYHASSSNSIGATSESSGNKPDPATTENKLTTDGVSPKPPPTVRKGREKPFKSQAQVSNLKSILLEPVKGKASKASVKKAPDRKTAGQISKRASELKFQIITLDDERSSDTDEYKKALLELSKLTEQHKDIVPSSMQYFLQQPDKLKLIKLLKSTAAEPKIEPSQS